MRTAAESKAFIQLMIKHAIKLSFIGETEKGGKGKTAERQRERARERVRALGGIGCIVGCKQTIRKCTCEINKMGSI